MSKVKFEFECSNCGKFFKVNLNMSLNGNYRIHCPMCNHIHYRVVENGKITGIRFTQNDDKILIEDIRPMKSSCRDFREEVAEDSDAVQTAAGFMRRLWTEKFSAIGG